LVIFNTLLKRLSDRVTEGVNVTLTKDDGLEKPEKMTLQGFGKKISKHLQGRAVADMDGTRLDAVFKPEVTNVNVAGFGAGGGAAIGGKMNSTLIVLFKDVAGDSVALGFHEMLEPNGVGKVITSADSFGFRRTLGIEFLFGRFANESTTAK
jgi:hypothetical protein